MKNTHIELIGYAASLFLIISFAMNDVVWLRIVNSVGCLLFVIYGILKKAYPVTVTNLIIIGLNVYHVWFSHA